MDYKLPRTPVSWFDIDSVDVYNLRAHLEQTPAQQSYIGEQLALAEKNLCDADDALKVVKARRFVQARQEPIERLSKKGGNEEIDCSDTLARYLAEQDPEWITACQHYNAVKYERDRWRAYQTAMSSKVSLLLVLGGIHRDDAAATR